MSSTKTQNVIEIKTGTLERREILTTVTALQGKKILIVGDVGLDEYVLGQVRRISPEAPVPVLEVEGEDMRLGLAGNVAQNVSSLGGIPLLVSVVGKDTGAELLKKLFAENKVSTEFLVEDTTRPTTRKTRVMAKHHHIVRVDYEVKKYLSEATEKQLLANVQKALVTADAVVIEDYAKGVISESVLTRVIELAHAAGKKVMVDPHRDNRGTYYKGVDLIKPNYDEAVALAGMSHDDLKENPNKVVDVGHALMQKTGAKEIVMTRGKDGMTIFSQDRITQVPTFARQVFDVTGAGDTVIAALSLSLAAGISLEKACILANFAAGYVVGKVGCVPCTVENLKEYIQSTESM